MDISFFYNHQIEYSSFYKETFRNLAASKLKELNFNGFKYVLQLNPGRIKSSTANINKPLDQSRCFLCRPNMPEYQLGMDYNKDFTLFVNPYPILKKHLTIVSKLHTPQTIQNNITTMLELAKDLENMVVFYNSPKSGASAPFHCHFQAGEESDLPVFTEIDSMKKLYTVNQNDSVTKINDGTRRFLVIENDDIQEATKEIEGILNKVNKIYNTTEPETNIGIVFKQKIYRIIVFPREKHRPDEYFRTDESRILVSPGFADMAGIIPCSYPPNFESITKKDIQSIMNQVSISEENFDKI